MHLGMHIFELGETLMQVVYNQQLTVCGANHTCTVLERHANIFNGCKLYKYIKTFSMRKLVVYTCRI